MNAVKTGAFYLAVIVIVVVAVFPFYYAILTSFKTGTALPEAPPSRIAARSVRRHRGRCDWYVTPRRAASASLPR